MENNKNNDKHNKKGKLVYSGSFKEKEEKKYNISKETLNFIKKSQKSKEEKMSKAINDFFNELVNKKNEKTKNQIAELLKEEKIKSITVNGNLENKNKDILNLDTRAALFLLNYCNKRNVVDFYDNENEANTTIKKYEKETFLIEKQKEKKRAKEEVKEGVNIIFDQKELFFDLYNEYNQGISSKDRKITIGKNNYTKSIYDIMKKAEILKEEPWIKNFVEGINEVINPKYTDELDKNGKKVFNEDYFIYEWTRSLAAFTDDLTIEEIANLYKNGVIEKINKPIKNKYLLSETGHTLIKDKKTNKSKNLLEAIKDKTIKVKRAIANIRRIEGINKKIGIVNENNEFGKILFQDFSATFIGNNDNKIISTIDNDIAFFARKAANKDTYIVWNKDKNYFYINSDKADLHKIEKKFNSKYKNIIDDVKENVLFGKIPDKMSKGEFIDILNLRKK